MTTQHTPGKWEVRNNDTVYSGDRIIADCEFTHYTQRPKPPKAEDMANARLIAAAPDLLDVLTRILKAHESDNNGAYMGEASLCEYFAVGARAAIAKATGAHTKALHGLCPVCDHYGDDCTGSANDA